MDRMSRRLSVVLLALFTVLLLATLFLFIKYRQSTNQWPASPLGLMTKPQIATSLKNFDGKEVPQGITSVIRSNGQIEYQITGVISSAPTRTGGSYNFIVSISNAKIKIEIGNQDDKLGGSFAVNGDFATKHTVVTTKEVVGNGYFKVGYPIQATVTTSDNSRPEVASKNKLLQFMVYSD